jgi:hypothetical protein
VREPTTPMTVQQVSADGATVPLVGGTWAEAKMLVVGAVEATREPDGASGATPRLLRSSSLRPKDLTHTRVLTAP